MTNGFTLNSYLRDLPQRYAPEAIERLVSRVPLDFNFRWYVVPEDLVAIDPYETFIAQVWLAPGAVLWGMSFTAIDGSANEYLLQMSDGGDQRRFFSSAVCGSMFASSNVVKVRPVLLAQPHLVSSGHLNIQITNTRSAASLCQLLLWTSEPPTTGGVR